MHTTFSAAIGLALFGSLFSSAAAPASAAGETCDGKAATIVVPPSDPGAWVIGTPGDDVIVGTDGWNRIDGAGGNDTICGLDRADEIIGGTGDDRLFGGGDSWDVEEYVGDVIQAGPGDDYIDLGQDGVDVTANQVSYADAPGPVTVNLTTRTATGHGHDTFAPTTADMFTGIIGSPFDDVLTGGPVRDRIDGGGGDDVISGGPGDDNIDGNTGNDIVSGGPGNDVVTDDHGKNVLRGEDGDDYLDGEDGSPGTTMLGGADDDILDSGPGSEARGGSDNDTLYYTLQQLLRPGEPERALAGGAGRDQLEFRYAYTGRRPGYDLLFDVPRRVIRHGGKRYATLSSVEDFLVWGNQKSALVTFRGGRKPERFNNWVGPLRAFGAGGGDELLGGRLDDLLNGGPGRDHLNGRAGRDRCFAGEQLHHCERRH